MAEDWISRWVEGRTGWHEESGNTALRSFWPAISRRSRVLVPLCGKSPDLLWLAAQGLEVTGVELSDIAVRDFFDEADLPFETHAADGLTWFRNSDAGITLVCGDYFRFQDKPFDFLYDRASLIALPPEIRPAYIQHTKALLKEDASQLLITLEYDQSLVSGPPFSVLPDEVRRYWNNLEIVASRNDIDNSPPKFRNAGLDEVFETVWVTA